MKYLAIKDNRLFVKAYGQGKKTVCKRIVVYILKDKSAEYYMKQNPEKVMINRIGYTVSKKFGHAVLRTRAKRIMREAYYKLIRENKIEKGYLIVFCVRDAAKGAKMNDIYKDMLYAFNKSGMII